MKTISLSPLAALLVAALVTGCVSSASDGRYQTNPRGGWDNFRAEAPRPGAAAMVRDMKRFRLKPLASLATMLATTLVAGCAGIPNDDRYQTHDGGRSNSRAEAPVPAVTLPS